MMSNDPRQKLRRRFIVSLPAFSYGVLIAPLHAQNQPYQISTSLMGTRLDVRLQGADQTSMIFAAQAALAEMQRLTDMMSRYRTTSVLNAINLAAGIQSVPVPPEMFAVLKMAQQMSVKSRGAFDVTVGSLRGWNFEAKAHRIPTQQEIATQLSFVDATQLILDEKKSSAFLRQRGALLDLGGIAKLPILQAGMQQLRAHGIANAMINGGGDVVVHGAINGEPWRIGLRDPRQPDQLLGVVQLHQGFVAASGDYERCFMHRGQRLHHILDPKTGYPTHGPHGLALISEDLAAINGLGAAIMVAGATKGRAHLAKLPQVDAFIVDANGQLWRSEGMRTRLQSALSSKA